MKKKLWETSAIIVGLIATVVVNFSVEPSTAGFGIAPTGEYYPMAMIDIDQFQLGMTLLFLAISLQLVSVWSLDIEKWEKSLRETLAELKRKLQSKE